MKKKTDHDADVIVVGGGLAGLTLAAFLGQSGVSVICIDREDPAATLKAAFDGRTTAISWGSRQILEKTGIWERLAPASCPINTIQILDGESPVLLQFAHTEVEGRTFGWIAENLDMRRQMLKAARALKTVLHIAPAVVSDFTVGDGSVAVHLADGRVFRAALVIGADGRNSFVREWMGIGARGWSYRQRAIVCTATHEHPHKNIAVEHFRHEGPFAILPMNDDESGHHRSSIVWTEHGPEKGSALRYDQETFDAALQARFPAWYGRVRQTGGRFSYPLGLLHAHNYIAPRMALAAEAAHAMHPIAGQGLNMGLRDIEALAELVAAACESGEDPGGEALLQTYQRRRRLDNMSMAGATDLLNRLFSNDAASLRGARRMGLRFVSRLPAAKKFFMKQAMGLSALRSEKTRKK